MNPNPVNPVNPVKTSSHTPGAWTAGSELVLAGPRPSDSHLVAYVRAQSETVAQCWLTGCDRGLNLPTRTAETLANARLIAAAPDMKSGMMQIAALCAVDLPNMNSECDEMANGLHRAEQILAEIQGIAARLIQQAQGKA